MRKKNQIIKNINDSNVSRHIQASKCLQYQCMQKKTNRNKKKIYPQFDDKVVPFTMIQDYNERLLIRI